ncbi:MAG: signal recognition particle-docking protein FtsY [Bacteroidetes bacterium]|jgi:fused signal recognition particle receptor|nr:signal recognition particle-docking protein FtsY [Bacteroidota bacterium]
MSLLNRFFGKKEKEDLNKGLEKTRESLLGRLSRLVIGRSSVDDDFLDELEAILISSDVGLETTNKIINRVQKRVSLTKYLDANELNEVLRSEMVDLLSENNTTDENFFELPEDIKPYVILVVGVNGVGKTTSIGKLAFQFKEAGFNVVLGAADTFRAAAVDQLKIWSERVSCHFYGKGMNADPAAVAYETVQYAIENKCDVAIIDTAGRLHTKVNLMNELSKIKRSVTKKLATAPNEVILVLDATTGQNAFEQAKHFTEATNVSGLILTKLDGTAKGGVAIGISDQFKIPIRFIGVGEGMHQLQSFRKREYVDAIFDK